MTTSNLPERIDALAAKVSRLGAYDFTPDFAHDDGVAAFAITRTIFGAQGPVKTPVWMGDTIEAAEYAATQFQAGLVRAYHESRITDLKLDLARLGMVLIEKYRCPNTKVLHPWAAIAHLGTQAWPVDYFTDLNQVEVAARAWAADAPVPYTQAPADAG
jgi:hypothetical protein